MQAGQEPANKPRPRSEGTVCGGKLLLIFDLHRDERSFRVSRSMFLLDVDRLHAYALLFCSAASWQHDRS